MTIPRYQKGAPLKAADLNLLSDAVARCRVLPGVGIKLTETVNGTVISLKPTRSGGGSSAPATENRPFDIINMRGLGQPDQNGGFSSYRAEVWPGTVANILPSNLFSGGKLTTFTFPSVLTYWKLKVLTDGRTITSAQILVEPDPPASQFLVPSAIPAEAEFLFGASFEGATYRTLGPSNPQVWINQAVVTDKTQPPPPGIPGVDRWYRIYIQ